MIRIIKRFYSVENNKFTAQMKKYIDKGKYKTVINLYDSLLFKDSLISIECINYGLIACLMNNKLEKFKKIYDFYKNNNYIPNCQTCCCLLSYYVAIDDKKSLFELYNNSKQSYSNIPVYHEPIFLYYSLHNQIKDILKLYDEVSSNCKISPLMVYYVLNTICISDKNEYYNEGYNIWKKYEKYDKSYENVIFCASKLTYKLNKLDEVLNIEKNVMENPDLTTYKYIRYFILSSIKCNNYEYTTEYIKRVLLINPAYFIEYFSELFPIIYYYFSKTKDIYNINEILLQIKHLNSFTPQLLYVLALFPFDGMEEIIDNIELKKHQITEIHSGIYNLYCSEKYDEIINCYRRIKYTLIGKHFLDSSDFLLTLKRYKYEDIKDIMKDIEPVYMKKSHEYHYHHLILSKIYFNNGLYEKAIEQWSYAHSLNKILKVNFYEEIDEIISKCISANDKEILCKICELFKNVLCLRSEIAKISEVIKIIFNDKEKARELRQLIRITPHYSDKCDVSKFQSIKRENKKIEIKDIFLDISTDNCIPKYPKFTELTIFER